MSSALTLVLASANPDKAAEIVAVLQEKLAVTIEPRPDWVPEVIEDGDTLEANARLKAAALCQATGKPAVADDTGLMVDALDGAPGVYSARFAGDNATYGDNVAKLVADMADHTDRRARFETVALVAFPDGHEIMARGICLGSIALAPRGDHGFGYDPVFIPDEAGGRTYAELSATEKNAISHRGRAFRALADALAASARD